MIQARQLSAKRGARHISPEDLIFIIRDDRAKVNRLRTYMSWKEVRKNAKEPGDGKADVDEAIDDGGEGTLMPTVLMTASSCVSIPPMS